MINGVKFSVCKDGKQIAICGTMAAAIKRVNDSPWRDGITILAKRPKRIAGSDPQRTVYDTSWRPWTREDALVNWGEYYYGSHISPVHVFSVGKTWCMNVATHKLDSPDLLRIFLVRKGWEHVWVGEYLFQYALPDVYNVVMKRMLEEWNK